MAKMQGITGKLSGKMGAAVFRVRDGQQVVSQYNPIVKNPNTEGQQSQRAKFKLITQLAAVMSPGFGTMGVNERPARGKMSQRNAFTKLNFPLVEVTSDAEEVTAKIPMEQLKLTSSFRYFPSLDLSSSVDTIAIDLEDSIPTGVKSVRCVTVGYPGNVPTLMDIRDIPSGSFLNTIEINVPAGKYTVLAYGLIPSPSAQASIDLNNIHTPADANFVSAVNLNKMVADGLIAETMTVGANVTVS